MTPGIRERLFDPAIIYVEGWIDRPKKMDLLCQEATFSILDSNLYAFEIIKEFIPELMDMNLLHKATKQLLAHNSRALGEILLYFVSMQNDAACKEMDKLLKQAEEILQTKK